MPDEDTGGQATNGTRRGVSQDEETGGQATGKQSERRLLNDKIAELTGLGQSIWIDYIRRGMIESGELAALRDRGVVGLTSNPTIFQKAIAESDDYISALADCVGRGGSADEIYETLVFEDIRGAAAIMEPVFRSTDGVDGYVCIEVNPSLAHDTAATVAEGKRIVEAIGRPNVMIKVPGTLEGLPAIEALLTDGINVNVTLIFSVDVYRQVMQAYLRGVKRFADAGHDPSRVASVASFFVSRIDGAVDKLLAGQIEAGRTDLSPLLGKAAIANTKLAYVAYQEVFERHDGPFAELRARGARVQRPLWASTSTKNPHYRDTYYIDTLIGPRTVNTVPPATLDALCDHLEARTTVTRDVPEAERVIQQLARAGIDLASVTADLRDTGVKLFADSFDALMADIEAKRLLRAASST